jgi:hypothetical protein
MDPAELRRDLEAALDMVALLSSGEELTEDDLENIDAVCADLREKLKVAPEGSAQHFPRDHWVFGVKRTQYTQFSVAAPDEGQAFCRAASYLHDNIEALRFSWDRRDPLSLQVLELKREPEKTDDPT